MTDFKPGDRIVWNSAEGPLEGVVLKVDSSVRDTGRGAGVGKIHGKDWAFHRLECKGPLRAPCASCGQPVSLARRYPWGNEPPSPERCWSVIRGTGTGRVDVPEGTAPVVEELCACGGRGEPPVGHRPPAHERKISSGKYVPARPQGASWCGAMDMAGNVWEWVGEGSAHGGSFRNDLNHTPGPHGFESRLGRWDHQQGPDTTADDVGFRVALSASP